jgi:hypothetical protein
MKIQRERMVCPCGHRFEGELIVEAPIPVAAAAMKAIRCPKCSGGTIYLDSPMVLGPTATGHLKPGMLRAIEVLEAYRQELDTERFLILGTAIVELRLEVEKL